MSTVTAAVGAGASSTRKEFVEKCSNLPKGQKVSLIKNAKKQGLDVTTEQKVFGELFDLRTKGSVPPEKKKWATSTVKQLQSMIDNPEKTEFIDRIIFTNIQGKKHSDWFKQKCKKLVDEARSILKMHGGNTYTEVCERMYDRITSEKEMTVKDRVRLVQIFDALEFSTKNVEKPEMRLLSTYDADLFSESVLERINDKKEPFVPEVATMWARCRLLTGIKDDTKLAQKLLDTVKTANPDTIDKREHETERQLVRYAQRLHGYVIVPIKDLKKAADVKSIMWNKLDKADKWLDKLGPFSFFAKGFISFLKAIEGDPKAEIKAAKKLLEEAKNAQKKEEKATQAERNAFVKFIDYLFG